jgi:CRP-like cAMP-binding protein
MNKSNEKQALSQLGRLPFFDRLSPEALQEVIGIGQFVQLGRYEFIYQKGMPSDKLFFLLEGVVKIASLADEGREIIKRVLYAPNLFGELGLVGEIERQDFAINISEEASYLILSVDAFKKYINQHLELSMSLVNWMGDRLRKVESRLESMIFKDARERIIDFLKDSAESQGKKIGYELLIKHCLTQQDIANITGTSRQTVTSVLNELKKSNLIHFNRRSILIRDLGKLV